MDNIFEDDALTQGQRLVWFALREMAVSGTAPDNCSAIAEHMDSARSYVSRALQTLDRLGWISRESHMIHVHESVSERSDDTEERESITHDRDSQTRNRDSEERDSQSRKGFPFPPFVFPQERISFNPLSPSHLSPSQRGGESSDSPSWWQRVLEPIWEAEPLPDDHPVRWGHLPGDWTFEFASAAMTHLDELDLLASPTEKKIERDGEDYVIAQWADTFRLLHEQDGYSQSEIKETMEWLFEGGNFWIENQAIRSVPPLRSKTSNGDAYKFDIMYQQAQSESDGTNDRPTRKAAKNNPEENWDRLARAASAA